MLAVPDRGVPLPRGERGVEHPRARVAVLAGWRCSALAGEHHVVGDVVAGQPGVPAHMPEQVEHAGVGAGGLQVHGLECGEHRRPVGAEVAGHQWDVIVPVVGGDGVDVAVLGGKPARVLHRRPRLLQRGLLPRGGRAVRVDPLEYRPVGAHQPLGDLLMVFLDLLEFVAGAFGDRGHPAAEHLRGLVAGFALGGENQRGQQRDPLRAAVVAQHRRVGRGCFPGEIGDLRGGNALPPAAGIPEPVDPALMLQLRAEL